MCRESEFEEDGLGEEDVVDQESEDDMVDTTSWSSDASSIGYLKDTR